MAPGVLFAQELVRLDPGLPEDCPECSLRHGAGMVGKSCDPAGHWILPDFMRPGGLAGEFETQAFQTPDDVAISKAGQPAHQAFTING